MTIPCAHVREYAPLTNVLQEPAPITPVSKFPERLKEAREKAKLSQAGLAKLAGVSAGSIGNWESGTRLSSRGLLQVAAALNVSAAWLSGDDSEPAPTPITRSTAGNVALLLARACSGLPERVRRHIAHLAGEMIENGPAESQASAIDALATVDVSLPLPSMPASSLFGVNSLDLDQDIEQTLSEITVRYTTLSPTQRSAMVAALQGIKDQSWDLTEETSSRYLARGKELSFERRPAKPKARGGRQ